MFSTITLEKNQIRMLDPQDIHVTPTQAKSSFFTVSTTISLVSRTLQKWPLIQATWLQPLSTPTRDTHWSLPSLWARPKWSLGNEWWFQSRSRWFRPGFLLEKLGFSWKWSSVASEWFLSLRSRPQVNQQIQYCVDTQKMEVTKPEHFCPISLSLQNNLFKIASKVLTTRLQANIFSLFT